MVINTNISAQVSARNLNDSSVMLNRSLARLSSIHASSRERPY
jgi:flagellin-like hook-associated protein FlgL